MNYIKIVIINVAVLFFLVGVLVITPPTVKMIYTLLKYDGNFHVSVTDTWMNLPNYKNISYSKQHFKEFNSLETNYFDSITWRRKPFSGETININKEGVRQSYKSSSLKNQARKFIFLGGSTVWGAGVSDEDTIPSLFSKKYNVESINYGETGYIARQSLAFLTNKYISSDIKNKENYIIFYDGVNDVHVGCRKENITSGSSREPEIRAKILNHGGGQDALSFGYIIEPWFEMIKKIKNNAQSPENNTGTYICHTDKDRAKQVAEKLVNSWLQAQNLAESNGDKFLAILQPVAYIGTPKLSHLDNTIKNKVLSLQYKTVYPLIKNQLMKHPKLNFLDLTNAYNVNEYYYIDFCHVTPNAHNALIKKLEFLTKNK